MKKRVLLLLVLAILVLSFTMTENANALSPSDIELNLPDFNMDIVPDFTLITPINPILLTPDMGLDFTIMPIIPAAVDSLYTNDMFYINSSMSVAPEELADPYVGIGSGGEIKFTYRYNKNLVEVNHVAVNSAFSMVGNVTYSTIDADAGIMEASFVVSMDQAHYSDDIVDKIISQVKFKVLEDGYGDSNIIASAWTDDAYHIEQIGSNNLGGGIVIPIFGNVSENRASYDTLSYTVKSLTINLKDDEGALLVPAYQVPYPADETVDAPDIADYELTSTSPLNVFSTLGQRRLLAVFEYAEIAEPEPGTDITINCYYDLEPPIIYTKTIAYPFGGYVFAPNLEAEGFKLLDAVSYKKVSAGSTVTFRYLTNNTGTHTAYIGGYPDSTVKSEKGITREEMAAILYRLIKDPNKASFVRTGTKFSDVTLSSAIWGGMEIEYVASLGLFTGYPDGRFLPKNNITREEFVTVLARFANYTPDTVTPVGTGSWSEDYVSLAVSCDYTDGLANSPAGENWLSVAWRKQHITRAEVIVMFNNLFNRKLSHADAVDIGSPFTDLPTSYWAFADIIEATDTHNYTRNADGTENYAD